MPFADANCVPLPGVPGDEWEDDFVMLADGFVSGWHAADLACVKAGSTLAVFGAGPIGLLVPRTSQGDLATMRVLPCRSSLRTPARHGRDVLLCGAARTIPLESGPIVAYHVRNHRHFFTEGDGGGGFG